MKKVATIFSASFGEVEGEYEFLVYEETKSRVVFDLMNKYNNKGKYVSVNMNNKEKE